MTRQHTELLNFSQGLDLVSSLDTMPPGYTPQAMNYRIAQYGGIEKILGYSTLADLGVGVAAVDLFYFSKRDNTSRFLIAGSSTLWQSVDSAGVVATIRSGMTAESDHSFVTYEDTLYGLGSANTLFKWTGAGLATLVVGTNIPVSGVLLGVWQNQLYYSPTANPSRVIWSAPGDFANFPALNFVDLGGAGESNKITAGQPVSDGLVVFCQGSTFIIYDSSTGANNVVDPRFGTTSRRSVSITEGIIYGANRDGIFATNGRFPLKIISERVDPLFRTETPNLSSASGVVWFGSYLLSFGRNGNGTNNQTLDLFTRKDSAFDRFGSLMLNEYPSHGWAGGPLDGSHETLYFIDASQPRYIRKAFTGGAFTTGLATANNIQCYYETPPLNLGTEDLKRLNSLRLIGHGGQLQVGVKPDYSSNMILITAVGFPLSGSAVWDAATWDVSLWGGYVLSQAFPYTACRARRFTLRFQESSQLVYPGRDVAGSGLSGVLGGTALYQIEPEFSVSSRRI